MKGALTSANKPGCTALKVFNNEGFMKHKVLFAALPSLTTGSVGNSIEFLVVLEPECIFFTATSHA